MIGRMNIYAALIGEGGGARVMLFVRAENMDCIILH